MINKSEPSDQSNKSLTELRAENQRMTEALQWIESQKHVRRAYRHMQFERLIDAAKYGLGESDRI